MTKLTNLQKALASNSGKVCVTIIRDDVLKVLFGSRPDPDIVQGLQALTDNKCFELLPDSCEQDWRFNVRRPQSAFQTGKAVEADLVEKGLEVEFHRGRVEDNKLVFSSLSTDSFSEGSDC